MITISSEIQKEAFEDTTDVFKLLDRTEQALFQISESNIKKNYADMGALMRIALDELDKKKDNQDGLTGVPSGFSSLDRLDLRLAEDGIGDFSGQTRHGKNGLCCLRPSQCRR